jgi:hypothetical protein
VASLTVAFGSIAYGQDDQGGATTTPTTGTTATTDTTDTDTTGTTDTDTTDTDTTGTTDTDTTDTTIDDGTTDDDGTSDGGTSLTDSDLDLDVGMRPESARIELLDLDSAEEEYIQMRFTRRIQNLDEADASGFFIQGFDPDDRVEATSVELVEVNSDEVLIGFEDGTDLLSYAVVGVDAGIVEDDEGDGNIPGSVEISNSRAQVSGRTEAPELESVELDRSLDRVVYEFDESLDEDQSANASAFGMYRSDGRSETGTEILSVEDRRVVVGFDSQVEDGTRFFVAADGVQDRQGSGNVPSSLGADTSVPDLTSARRENNTQWLFTFDETVSDPQASSFVLYSTSGDVYPAENAEIRREGRTVQATFPEVRDFPDDIAVAVVEEGAVTDLGADDSNTLGSEELTTSSANVTVGPDLGRVTLKPEAGEVIVRFDEEIDEDASANATAFHIITDSGEVVDGETILVVDEDEKLVQVEFPESAVEAAGALVVDEDAVMDLEGNGNVVRTRVLGGGGEAVLGASAGPGSTGGISERRGDTSCDEDEGVCR